MPNVILKLSRKDRLYAIDLYCQLPEGKKYHKQWLKQYAGSANKGYISALAFALSRFNKPSHISIYANNAYIVNILNEWLERWSLSDWKNAKGKPVANVNEWRTIWQLIKGHEITAKENYGGIDT